MKKLLKISLLAFIILILNTNTNYAATPTLSDIANTFNSASSKISSQVNTLMELDGLDCVATNTENTLKISLTYEEYDYNVNDNVEKTDYFEYSLSNNILSRTTSNQSKYEELVFKLLIDCIGQLHGNKPGDLYYTLYFSDSDEDNNIYDLSYDTYNNIYNLNLEKDGILVKNSNNGIYEFKADITKTADFSNVYIEESDLKPLKTYLSGGYNPLHINKGFLISYYQYQDTTLHFAIAEKNNLTENSYKSILSIMNLLFKDSNEKINNFKKNFPNLSIGDTTFDGIDIKVAPTEEEADKDYWMLGNVTYDSYKLVVLSIPLKNINPDLLYEGYEEDLEEENITTPSTPKPSPSNIVPTPTPTPTKEPSTTTTDKLQQNVDKVTGSINKLPQTGKFLNLEDSLILLSIFSLLVLITIIIKDIKYKNITKK